jgi:hypothetical protein
VAYVRTILKLPLDDDKHELHVIRPNNDDPVLLSITTVGDASAVRIRPTVRMSKYNAEKLGKFLCGIQTIDGVQTERIERETTKPGVADE